MNAVREAGQVRRALWIYPWDVLDGGIDEVVARAANEWGLTALSLCSSYHSAKFLLPRRRTEKVFLSGGSAVYFRPDDARYQAGPIRPFVTPRTELLDVLDRTADACRRHGLSLRAWTIALHNSRLGEAHPDVAEVNAFGDTYPWALCPSHPDARAYAAALVRDLATNHDLDALDVESIGFHGLRHGHHHELVGVSWGAVEEFLMGLCFCSACIERAGNAGIDGESLRARVAGMLDARFRSEAAMPPEEPTGEGQVVSLLTQWDDLRRYVQVRLDTVTSLVASLKQEALAGTKTALALTASTFQRGAQNAWLEGMDLRALAGAADEIIILSYFTDPVAVRGDVRFGVECVEDPARLVVGMSLLAQGTTSEANLVAKVAAARDAGAGKFSFYNYGFVSEARLGWLRALAG
jgi:hypothetical protein